MVSSGGRRRESSNLRSRVPDRWPLRFRRHPRHGRQAQADLVPLLRRNSDIVIAPSNPQGYIGGLRFNCLHPPFDDVRLRRAVLVAVNQEDYMRTIMGDDRSTWRICRSQYPCGSTYGVEVDLPVQKETSRRPAK